MINQRLDVGAIVLLVDHATVASLPQRARAVKLISVKRSTHVQLCRRHTIDRLVKIHRCRDAAILSRVCWTLKQRRIQPAKPRHEPVKSFVITFMKSNNGASAGISKPFPQLRGSEGVAIEINHGDGSSLRNSCISVVQFDESLAFGISQSTSTPS